MQNLNLQKIEKSIVENNRAIKAFAYCIKLSWHVSKVYTVLQFLAQIVSGFLPVLITWNTKEIIDLLSVDAGAETWRRKDLLLIRIGVMLLLFLLKLFAAQIHTYVSAMQRDKVLHFVEQELSVTAMRMKLEYFDDPKYYDMFETVRIDIFSLSSAMNDGVFAVSYAISLCSCFYFLAGLGPAYTVLIVAATVVVRLQMTASMCIRRSLTTVKAPRNLSVTGTLSLEKEVKNLAWNALNIPCQIV